MLSQIQSAGLCGIDAHSIEVEVDISLQGFPKWHTVGLPESEVKESKERISSAIKNSGYDFTQRKITINLAPADVKKEGTGLDLPMALGLLASSELIPTETLSQYLCVGELSLNGELRPVRGALSIAVLAAKRKMKGLILPAGNAREASVVQGIAVYPLKNLSEVVEFLNGRLQLTPFESIPFEVADTSAKGWDYNEICGQQQAKRALEVAAAGGHNILFIGPPGSGKTMLASRISTILPPLSFLESLETSRIYSVVSQLPEEGRLLSERPFRAPHHTISDAGLIGGGRNPKPGEVSLAHHGVLFLDEFPEFKKHVLEVLRQPLESGQVTISRAAQSLTYPASFMLVAAMNPCPCGYQGHPRIACTCHPLQIQKYRGKLSGPLLDRIDLQIEVPPVPFEEMTSSPTLRETSNQMRTRVLEVRKFQQTRFEGEDFWLNSQMGPGRLRKYCQLKPEGKSLLRGIVDKFHLSARAFDRILKVSRTLADMEASPQIETQHLLEAVQYRSLDRRI